MFSLMLCPVSTWVWHVLHIPGQLLRADKWWLICVCFPFPWGCCGAGGDALIPLCFGHSIQDLTRPKGASLSHAAKYMPPCATSRADSCKALFPFSKKRNGEDRQTVFSCTWTQVSVLTPAEKPGQGIYINTIQMLSKSLQSSLIFFHSSL